MSSKKTVFFTISSSNYIAQAAVFHETLRAHHPDAVIRLFLTDRPERAIDCVPLEDVVFVEDIGVPDFDFMSCIYEVTEFNTAVKPFCFAHLLADEDVAFACYIDPDTWIFAPLSELRTGHEAGVNIFLTPHTLDPVEDKANPNDFDMAKSGIYNLGFCSVRNSTTGRRFIGWWCRKLLRDCRVDIANGIFVDQKWCDGVPALFEGTEVLRHPGYNVGYWNLMHRAIAVDDNGRWTSNGQPLKFFHFSGLPMLDGAGVSKYQNRFEVRHFHPDLQDLFLEYRLRLMEKGFFAWRREAYRPRSARIVGNEVVARNAALVFEQTNGAADDRTLIAFLSDLASSRGLAMAEFGPDTAIPDLLYIVLRSRPDLRSAMGSPTDLAAFESRLLHWASTQLLSEHPVAGELDRRMRVTLDILAAAKRFTPPGGRAKVYPALWSDYIAGLKAGPLYEVIAGACTDFGGARDTRRQPLPGFTRDLLASREDLASAFDIASVNGRAGVLRWLEAEMQKTPDGVPFALKPLIRAIKRHGADWVAAVAETAGTPGEVPMVAQHILDGVRFGEVPPHETAFYKTDPLDNTRLSALERGALLIGYPRAEMGMGEHVRNSAVALEGRDYPFAILDFDPGLNCGVGDRSVQHRVTRTPRHEINVFHINADQVLTAEKVLGRRLFDRALYNVGYWAWELERFPAAWSGAIELVDELWAPSGFIRSALRLSTGKPVITMPLRVEPGETEPCDLTAHGVHADDFVFLFYFDFASYPKRKNPEAVIRAFRTAFPEGSSAKVKLVVKTIGADDGAPALEALRTDVAADPRIVLLSGTMPKARLNGLIERASCFVSLHRSEGFGRGLAEAMWFGKPVIGTGYSGNMDFMDERNAFLVDYRLVPVRDGEYVHPSGARWAEPSVDHAAGQMTRVVEDRAEAERRAALGRETIRTRHSTEAVGRNLVERLERIRAGFKQGAAA